MNLDIDRQREIVKLLSWRGYSFHEDAVGDFDGKVTLDGGSDIYRIHIHYYPPSDPLKEEVVYSEMIGYHVLDEAWNSALLAALHHHSMHANATSLELLIKEMS